MFRRRVLFLLILLPALPVIPVVLAPPAGAALNTASCADMHIALEFAEEGDIFEFTEPDCLLTDADDPYVLRSGVSITFRGAPGTGTVIRRTNNQDRLLEGHNPRGTIIDGLTFQRGGADEGGGVELTGNVSVQIVNSAFYENEGGVAGGGLHIDSTVAGAPQVVISNTIFGRLDPPVPRNGAFLVGGGAALELDNGLLFTGNTIHNNAALAGGGIYLDLNHAGSAPPVVIEKSNFVANEAPSFLSFHGVGAGLFIAAEGAAGPDITLRDNVFSANRATKSGAGAAVGFRADATSLRLEGNTFSGNTLDCETGTTDCGPSQGAGLYVFGSDTDTIVNSELNRFEGNRITETAETDHYGGGGAWIEGIGGYFTESDRYTGNTVQGYDSSNCSASDTRTGGGLGVSGTITVATNLAVAGNAIGNCGQGGGVWVGGIGGDMGDIHLFDSTVSGNQVGKAGTAPAVFGSPSAARFGVTNTIVVGNEGDGTPEVQGFTVRSYAFSDACQAADFGGGVQPGPGNVCLDPLLADPLFPAGDVHQTPGSPTLDAGNNSLVPTGLSEDYELDRRIADGDTDGTSVVDMGADEAPGNTDLSVDKADSEDPIQAGTLLPYTITVTNNGPDPAGGVQVVDTLPAGVTLVDPGPCTEDAGVLTCALGPVGSGDTSTFTVVVRPDVPGTITNTAAVSFPGLDPDPANNSDTETTLVTFAGGGQPICPGPLWYLAEGSTRDGFDEFLLMFNTSPTPAAVTVSYTVDGGPVVVRTHTIAGLRRLTVPVYDDANLGRNKDHGTIVSSDQPILVERSMYVRANVSGVEVNGDHNAIAEAAPRQVWYFSEGTSLADFQTYFTVSNPTGSDTLVTAIYGKEGGGTVTKLRDLPAFSRITIDANSEHDGVGPGVVGFSTVISATVPVLAERPVYFDHAFPFAGGDVAVNGATDTFGVTPGKTWYLAEGNVLPDFAMFLTLGNPAPVPIDATITYNLEGADPIDRVVTVGANSRLTVPVFDATGPGGIGRDVSDPVSRGVGVVVQTAAETGVVVERAMYFGRPIDPALPPVFDGHATAGYPGFEKVWFFAEGTGIATFRTFLTITNPQGVDAVAEITYFPDDDSGPIVKSVVIPGGQRKTVQTYSADDPAGYAAGKTGFSMKVASALPLLVERPEYEDHEFPSIGVVNGGNVSIGLPDACGASFG